MKPLLARYANEILGEVRRRDYDDHAARRVVFAACAGLRAVHDELRPQGSISAAMRTLRSRLTDHRHEVSEIVNDADIFLSVFISQEARVLLRAGLRRDVVDLVLNEAEALRTDLLQFDGSPAALRERLEPLMRDVCEISERYPSYMEKSASPATRAGWVILGALIVGTNGAADALATGGMIPAATALSGALGGHVMSKHL